MSDRSLRAVLAGIAEGLQRAGIEDSAREARLIASDVLGIPMARMTLSLDEPVGAEKLDLLHPFVARRAEGRPLAQVLGHRAFFKHSFRVTDQVLDPRPETETLVQAALTVPFARVLDLGTGSGAILLSLLAERTGARGVGVDLSDGALAVAGHNAQALGVSSRCALVCSDWFAQVEGRFDLIVSNPPYIAADEMAGLDPGLSFEPRMALTDESDGLEAYRILTAQAGGYLMPDGWLMVEIGHAQGSDVFALFEEAGFADVQILPDLDGRDRVLRGKWNR